MKDIPDVEIKKSLFTFTPKYLQLSETTVNIGKNDITADSRFENYIGYVLKGTTLKGTLNIRSNYFNLNDFMTASTDEAATSDAAATDSVATSTGVVEVPRNIDFQMDANLKQVLFDKMSFNNMNGKLVGNTVSKGYGRKNTPTFILAKLRRTVTTDTGCHQVPIIVFILQTSEERSHTSRISDSGVSRSQVHISHIEALHQIVGKMRRRKTGRIRSSGFQRETRHSAHRIFHRQFL